MNSPSAMRGCFFIKIGEHEENGITFEEIYYPHLCCMYWTVYYANSKPQEETFSVLHFILINENFFVFLY